MWKASKLWSIEYEEGDLVGKLLCHISMLAIIQPFVSLGVAVSSRSMSALRLTTGLILATIVARGLKLLVDSPRPDVGHIVMPGNSGFPSDHSLSGNLRSEIDRFFVAESQAKTSALFQPPLPQHLYIWSRRNSTLALLFYENWQR